MIFDRAERRKENNINIEKVQAYLLMSYCFCLSIVPSVSIFCLISLGVSLFIQRPPLRWNILFYSFIAVYILFGIGCFYSSNTTQSFIELEQKLSLLIWPLVLFTLPKTSEVTKNHILDAFILGCILAISYRLIHAFWFYDVKNLLFSTPFSNQLFNSHPTFAAIYAAFAFFLLGDKVIKGEKSILTSHKVLTYGSLFLLYISLFFYASRMAIITFTLVLATVTIVFFFQKKKFLQSILLVLFQLILVYGSIQAVSLLTPTTSKGGTTTSKRFERLKEKNPRVEIWASSWVIFKSNPILGTGTGDVKDDLLVQYKARNFKKGFDSKYDAHNQYIEIALAIGVLGLLMFLISLLLPLFFAVQQKEYVYLLFLSLFMLASLTDNMLENQEGVLLYAFFNSFFASHFLNEPQK